MADLRVPEGSCVMTTVAPDTGVPDASVTVPRACEYTCCADATDANASMSIAAARLCFRDLIDIGIKPLVWLMWEVLPRRWLEIRDEPAT